jgi:hypothetical protein
MKNTLRSATVAICLWINLSWISAATTTQQISERSWAICSTNKWSISNTISGLNQLYWFNLIVSDLGRKPSGYTVEYLQQDMISTVLTSFCEVLDRYPDNFVKKAHIQEIYLLKDMKNPQWERMWWYTSNGRIWINTHWRNIEQFHHELFHRLDNNDGDDDDHLWKQLNVINAKDTATQSANRYHPLWYADDYGISGWVNEDQATIAEYLFDTIERKKLLHRAQSDTILRKKIMIITWCFFDTITWKFTKDLTKEEYKDIFWSKDFEYYAKWSQKYGWLRMSYTFWNSV